MTHRGENVGTTPFQNIVVALLYPEPGRFTPGMRADGAGYHSSWTTTACAPGGSSSNPASPPPRSRRSAPGLRVVVDPSDIVEMVPGQPDRAMHLRLGDFFWQDAGTTRAVRNSGTSKLNLIEFELIRRFQGDAPRMRLKLARTLASVSARCASSVAKSGTSAARVSSPTSPGAAVAGSNGAGRHSRRICVRL